MPGLDYKDKQCAEQPSFLPHLDQDSATHGPALNLRFSNSAWAQTSTGMENCVKGSVYYGKEANCLKTPANNLMKCYEGFSITKVKLCVALCKSQSILWVDMEQEMPHYGQRNKKGTFAKRQHCYDF